VRTEENAVNEPNVARSRVQDIIWDIMGEIRKYLDAHQMEYYMLGGTLLGAVRHRGFIPWDDDMDIGIPRSQYERFLREIGEALPEHLRLHTYWDDSSHHYYFSRIVDTRYALRRMGSEVERDEEVWVDIFPLDGMPNDPLIRRVHMLRLLYNRAMYHIATFDKVNLKRPNRPFSERAVIRFVQLTGFGRNADAKKYLDKIDKLLKKYPPETSGWIVNFMGQYKFREMFPKSWYGGGRLYDFEDTQLMGPEKADLVLTKQYGDYMTPPKDADKNAHAAEPAL